MRTLRQQLRQLDRSLYVTDRAVGDVRAALKGPEALARRLIRRSVTRELFRILGR